MLKRFNELMKRHLADNVWTYFIIIFLFVLGVSLGALSVNGIDADTKAEVKSYIQGFLSISASDEINNGEVLKQSIKFNLFFTFAVYLLGFTYFGILLTPLLTSFRGFCIGFTVAFLTESLGRGGYLLSIASVLPQNVIIVPALFIISVCSMNASMLKLKNRFSRKTANVNSLALLYTVSVLAIFVFLMVGSMIEAYLTPEFIKLITSYIS